MGGQGAPDGRPRLQAPRRVAKVERYNRTLLEEWAYVRLYFGRGSYQDVWVVEPSAKRREVGVEAQRRDDEHDPGCNLDAHIGTLKEPVPGAKPIRPERGLKRGVPGRSGPSYPIEISGSPCGAGPRCGGGMDCSGSRPLGRGRLLQPTGATDTRRSPCRPHLFAYQPPCHRPHRGCVGARPDA